MEENKPKKKKFFKILLIIIAIILLLFISFFIYSYLQGGKGNYTPPKQESQTSLEQVTTDLTALSNAIESYYAMNLSYPDSLSQLTPDFIAKLPKEPLTNENYIYKVLGDSGYEVQVKNPKQYELTEFKVQNGKIIKK